MFFIAITGKGISSKSFQNKIPLIDKNGKSPTCIQDSSGKDFILPSHTLSSIQNQKDDISALHRLLAPQRGEVIERGADALSSFEAGCIEETETPRFLIGGISLEIEIQFNRFPSGSRNVANDQSLCL